MGTKNCYCGACCILEQLCADSKIPIAGKFQNLFSTYMRINVLLKMSVCSGANSVTSLGLVYACLHDVFALMLEPPATDSAPCKCKCAWSFENISIHVCLAAKAND